TVVVDVKMFHAHRSPGRSWKMLGRAPDELLTLDVLVVLIIPLHIQDVEVRPSIAIAIHRRGIAGPALVDEADVCRHVLEARLSQVAKEDASFGSSVNRMCCKGILPTRVVLVPASCLLFRGTVHDRRELVGRIDAHIRDEQIYKSVSIVIKEDCS